MAGFIPQDVLSAVKDAADIADVVSRYLPLKKAGKNLKALCPFHTEKTPSFVVHPDRQFFRCYGCGKSGDVFTFVAEHERVEFPEAVRIVAHMVGIAVPDTTSGRGGPSKELKTRLYELHQWAARFFARQLAETDAGRAAREYLAARHFDNETVEAWGLGYAPDSWDALGKAATRAKFTDQELLSSGLVIARDSGQGYYDRFRNRLMFPIRDRQGRTIAFGARALGDSEVKYINSPKTPLFNKGRCFYGFDQARDAVADGGRVLIAEGYTDVLRCHQHGIEFAVATLGTALTGQHVRRLRHYADQVILVFDADAAGERAVDRSLEVFADADLEARVATTEAGTDPCDFIDEQGPAAFLERVDAARPLFEVKLDLACGKHDVTTADGRAQAIDEALAVVALVSNAAKADLLMQETAKRMGVALDAVRRRRAALQRSRRRRRRDKEEAGPAPAAPLDPVERGVLCSVLALPELVPCVLARAALEDFQDGRVRRILKQSIELYDREGTVDPAE
ncbi:MAG: DNA primase, partial [Planctomycetota bacterium]